jgi:hypothetical protein
VPARPLPFWFPRAVRIRAVALHHVALACKTNNITRMATRPQPTLTLGEQNLSKRTIPTPFTHLRRPAKPPRPQALRLHASTTDVGAGTNLFFLFGQLLQCRPFIKKQTNAAWKSIAGWPEKTSGNT